LVDGLEVQVNLEGPQEWDCTVFAAGYRAYVTRLWPDPYGWRFDRREVFKADPAAPGWARDWAGPFRIYVMEVSRDQVGAETAAV